MAKELHNPSYAQRLFIQSVAKGAISLEALGLLVQFIHVQRPDDETMDAFLQQKTAVIAKDYDTIVEKWETAMMDSVMRVNEMLAT